MREREREIERERERENERDKRCNSLKKTNSGYQKCSVSFCSDYLWHTSPLPLPLNYTYPADEFADNHTTETSFRWWRISIAINYEALSLFFSSVRQYPISMLFHQSRAKLSDSSPVEITTQSNFHQSSDWIKESNLVHLCPNCTSLNRPHVKSRHPRPSIRRIPRLSTSWCHFNEFSRRWKQLDGKHTTLWRYNGMMLS